MKKWIISMCFLTLISILSACDDGQSLLFTGQSKHWKGDYTTNVGGNNEDGTYTFKYKNGVNPTFKNLEVDISDGSSHLKDKKASYTGSTIKENQSGMGIDTTKANTVIKVTIKWDNKYKETFSLKPKQYN